MTTYQVPREFAMGGSYVDETLFGESRAKKTAARRRAASRAGQSMVGASEGEVLKINRNDWEAIKRRANAPLSKTGQGSSSPTRQRKQHRVPIKPLVKSKPTPAEEYERQYRETVGVGGANIRAFNMRNEELDEVKALQSHLEVMKVKAEVDAGLEMKRRRQEQIEAYERQKEQEMEEVRQRGLRADAEKHARKQAMARAAQQELLDQVARNHQLELLEEERLAQENLQMRRHLEKLAEVDRQKKIEAQAAQARRNIELAKSNQLAEKYRVIAREQNEKEDQEIASYLAKKAAAQEYRLRQAEKLRQEEELAVARMRELQERSQVCFICPPRLLMRKVHSLPLILKNIVHLSCSCWFVLRGPGSNHGPGLVSTSRTSAQMKTQRKPAHIKKPANSKTKRNLLRAPDSVVKCRQRFCVDLSSKNV